MSAPSAIPQPLDAAASANAEDGFVVLDGPNGLAVTMTAEAAAQTGRNLLAAARAAEAQLAGRG